MPTGTLYWGERWKTVKCLTRGAIAVIDSHRGLTDEQSIALNARIVLLLANHIGDTTVLDEAFRTARLSLLA